MLLQTKLYIPATRSDLVLRPNLIERLNAGLAGNLTLVSAPAGFGKTTLLSPWFDLSSVMEAQVNYRRWYTNDTGSSPGQDYWLVQITDDGSNWVDLENTNTSDRSWALKTFVLDDYVELTSTVRFRFIASDEGDGSVVEAGVDEFDLTGFTVVIDLSGSVDGGEFTLDWTTIPGATNYWIYGADNDAYFVPSIGNRIAVVPGGTTTWSSSSGVGDPDHNWTYLVVAVDGSEQELNQSNRFGEYDRGLILISR